MNRSPAFKSLYAIVALFVTSLQVIGALHFALVPHGYSTALGGIVHIHAAARAALPAARVRTAQAPAMRADSASCLAERCPVADAPPGSAPRFELLAAGRVAFGDARLLSERSARVPESLRVFLSAPKTSPPV